LSYEIRVERLSPEEAPRLRALRLAALTEAPDAFGSTLAESAARSLADWARQLEKLPTFFAVHEGRDVGMVRGDAHEGVLGEAFLLSMWVAPEARGQGVGEALIEALLDWARGAGFQRVVLDVADQNAPAIALYARCGFVPTGETGSLPPPREQVREHRRARLL
jgi:ribosomal protein S18 acetylase RimI-like enzyme